MLFELAMVLLDPLAEVIGDEANGMFRPRRLPLGSVAGNSLLTMADVTGLAELARLDFATDAGGLFDTLMTMSLVPIGRRKGSSSDQLGGNRLRMLKRWRTILRVSQSLVFLCSSVDFPQHTHLSGHDVRQVFLYIRHPNTAKADDQFRYTIPSKRDRSTYSC